MTTLYENRVLQSEAMATSPWSVGAGMVATNNTSDVTDPHGGSTATKLVYDGSSTAGQLALFQNIGAGVIGDKMALGIWIRVATGSTTVQLNSNLGTSFVSFTVDTTWRFIEIDQVAAQNGSWFFLLYRGAGDNVARTFYAAFAQGAKRSTVGPYKKTTTSIVVGPQISTGRKRFGFSFDPQPR